MTPRTEAGRKHRGHLGRVTMLPLDYFDDDIEAVEREAAPLDVEKLRYRDRLLQAKVREYAVALAIATQGDLSSALREAETWLARLAAEPNEEPGAYEIDDGERTYRFSGRSDAAEAERMRLDDVLDGIAWPFLALARLSGRLDRLGRRVADLLVPR